MADDLLGQIANPNNQSEAALLQQARDAVGAGADQQKVAERLTGLVHQYRTSLGQVKDAPEQPPTIQKVAEAVGGAFPGGAHAIAGFRALTGGSKDTEGDVAQQEKDVASLPLVGRLAAGIPGTAASLLAGPLSKLGATAAMGTMGALQGADRAASSPGARLGNAALSGTLSAASVPILRGVGAVAGNIADKTGLTDAVAKGVNRLSPDLAASMGTRGQVNNVLQDRQDILGQLGDNGTAAGKVQLDRIAATRAKAGELYGIAKQDKQAINDPRITALLQDPEVANTLNTVKSLRNAQGNPLPSVNNIAAPPQAQMNKLIRPEDWAHMMSNPKNAAALQQIPTGLSGLTTTELPDPEALSAMKRYLGDASRGLNSPLEIKKDAAIATLDKVKQLRDVLHEVSPPWQQADAFYSDAKGQEEAFANGYDAFRHANNPSGEQLPTHTADAMLQHIETPRYATEPPEAMANRADAFHAGVRANAASQIKGAPVDRNLTSVMKQPAFAGDEETQGIRKLGFADPAQAQNLESTLATQRAAATASPSAQSHTGVPVSRYGALGRAAKFAFGPQDALPSAVGQSAISARLGNPAFKAAELEAAKRGESLQQVLKRASMGNVVTQENRPQ